MNRATAKLPEGANPATMNLTDAGIVAPRSIRPEQSRTFCSVIKMFEAILETDTQGRSDRDPVWMDDSTQVDARSV